jgi:hypothetical protein
MNAPMQFQKASKSQARLRLALIGPAGSGKTMTALRIAAAYGGRIALIDTEHGTASKYADQFDFQTLDLNRDFDPRRYVEAIHLAEENSFDFLIIDSLSHAWSGKGGALEQVDEIKIRSKSNNSFTAWRDVTPIHNDLVESILQSSCHIIATMRSKTEYVQEKDTSTGKTVIRKVGTVPIQRDGMEYEFDVVADMTVEHQLIVSKTRCPALDGAVIPMPGKEISEELKKWLTDGAPMVVRRFADGSEVPSKAYEAFDTYTVVNGSPPLDVEILRAWVKSQKG